MQYDIVVLGGGPGGYMAAIRAAQLGAKVCVIEEKELGGICLNWGCIPTKALVASAEVLRSVKHSAEFGIDIDGWEINFAKVMERKNAVVSRLIKGISFLFEKYHIDNIKGRGKLISPNKIEVVLGDGEQQIIEGKNLIIATGSSPILPQTLNFDGINIVSSNEMLDIKEIPKTLAIVGGGVIGCEFASIFSEMGSEVTIIDIAPTILPGIDKDLSKQLLTSFKRKGIKVKTKIGVAKAEVDSAGVKVSLDNGEVVNADKVLIAIGRSFNTKGIGLEDIGINLGEKGEIIVDEYMQTSVSGVFAIGDVINKVLLAHVASAQGKKVAETILKHKSAMDYSAVPNCIFTSPEIASVGMTTQQVEEQGRRVKVGKVFFLANGKALTIGETDGFVKVIIDADNDSILGIHIIGPHASDLIAEGAVLVQKKLKAEDLIEVIHAHPTLAEAILEAAEAAIY